MWLSRQLVAWVLLPNENQGQDKRVESASVPCLDAGSNPASSTRLHQLAEWFGLCDLAAEREGY